MMSMEPKRFIAHITCTVHVVSIAHIQSTNDDPADSTDITVTYARLTDVQSLCRGGRHPVGIVCLQFHTVVGLSVVLHVSCKGSDEGGGESGDESDERRGESGEERDKRRGESGDESDKKSKSSPE